MNSIWEDPIGIITGLIALVAALSGLYFGVTKDRTTTRQSVVESRSDEVNMVVSGYKNLNEQLRADNEAQRIENAEMRSALKACEIEIERLLLKVRRLQTKHKDTNGNGHIDDIIPKEG